MNEHSYKNYRDYQICASAQLDAALERDSNWAPFISR